MEIPSNGSAAQCAPQTLERLPRVRQFAMMAGLVAGSVVISFWPVVPARSPNAVADASCPQGTTIAAESGTSRLGSGTCVLDGRTITHGGLSVPVPVRGAGVAAEAQDVAGDHSLIVTTGSDGVITVEADEHEHATALRANRAIRVQSAATATCSDGTYRLSGWKLRGPYVWYYNWRGAPASVASGAADAIYYGSRTAAIGANSCGQRATVNITQQYRSYTTRTAQIDGAGRCTGNDGYNVTSWRAMSGSWLAMTCTYFVVSGNARHVTNSDAAFDTSGTAWFNTMPRGCRTAYDLRSVATHERGHTFGLGHVSQNVNPNQVMTPALHACSTAKRSLGLGDYRGLAHLYGTH